ncbi:MAG TPA: malto-oligosyltrehalose trehalohydrolase [Burkholderiales bacterium]|nr:malto-oligosyltrehalose trehalohydrolase [Burkholderiales bacterium]
MQATDAALTRARRYPVGAELVGEACVAFRVWAPLRKRVGVLIEQHGSAREVELNDEGNGYFSTIVENTRAGSLYRFRLDGDATPLPDPVSRFQPQGADGPSQIIDPHAYDWHDAGWRGVSRERQVAYEMHIGTFTREGTWTAAMAELPWLAMLGVTVLEVMPVCEFAGGFGWGYDLVHFYAPTRLYGTPDEMRAFVDAAHASGLGVILDVVYNHCGTTGCFLPAYAPYFSRRHRSDWGNALNFDEDDAAPVREYFKANAAYWIDEFHLDGFRLDATQTIFDRSSSHILGELVASARAAAGPRELYIVAENEPQHTRLLAPADAGGAGVDALWNDDFHHSARVAVTGRAEAYYTDYLGTPQELVSAAKYGFLYQGQYYRWQKQSRGTPTRGLDASRFVAFLQNHDQVANSARGLRLHALTTPGRYRAITALFLLLPQTPLLFQGQEFAASAPFLYFADNPPENRQAVREGRAEFLNQFPSIAGGGHAWLRDPAARDVFERCKLDWSERDAHREAVALHRDLLALRNTDPVLSAHDAPALDGAVLHDEAFVLRYFSDAAHDRILVVNLGREVELSPCPEPLLAPPAGAEWALLWSSEDAAYGGEGTPGVCTHEGEWRLPAHAAVLFAARAGAREIPPLPRARAAR